MVIFVVLLAIIAIIVFASVLIGVGEKKKIQVTIERHRQFVESMESQARIIVNNGTHFFFVDDATQTYGIDDSGTRYYLNNIFSLSIRKGGLSIQQHATPQFIDIGKSSENSLPLDKSSIDAIASEILVYIRQKLNDELSKQSITPTVEYLINGSIWGCDVNSKKFYNTQGGIGIYNFSDLVGVSIDDGYASGTQIKVATKCIHVCVKTEWDDDLFEYDLYIDNEDETYMGFLSMLKGIRNRA
ncbi:MAG: hypothetical protein ACI3XO_02690 [Eubacteriales bacterium]